MDIKVDNLRISFDSGAGFELEIGTVELRRGEVCFLLGMNGSGKSVMLKLISGELQPDTGRVSLKDGGGARIAHPESVGIVKQNADQSLALDLTVLENLALRMPPHSVADWLIPKRLRKSAEAAVSQHRELPGRMNSLVGELSIGQRQALAFLAVAQGETDILLLDEFLSATDMRTGSTLRRFAREYADRVNAAVVVVTHDLSIALADGDRALILRDGRVVADVRRAKENEWSSERLEHLIHGD